VTQVKVDHLACGDLQVLLDLLAKKENQVRMENQVQLDPQDPPDAEVYQVCLEYLDQKDTEDSLVLMEPRERWVDLDLKERMDPLVLLDHKDLLDQLDLEVNVVEMDLLVLLD